MLYRVSLLKAKCGLRVRHVEAKCASEARVMAEAGNPGWSAMRYVEVVDDVSLHASRKVRLASKVLEALR